MTQVFKSKYTSGFANGENVNFKKGEKVRYRMRNGSEMYIVIDSEQMLHSGYLGYEAIFPDGERCFAVSKGIVSWEGKR